MNNIHDATLKDPQGHAAASGTGRNESKTPVTEIAGRNKAVLRQKIVHWATEHPNLIAAFGWTNYEEFKEVYEDEDIDKTSLARAYTADVNDTSNMAPAMKVTFLEAWKLATTVRKVAADLAAGVIIPPTKAVVQDLMPTLAPQPKEKDTLQGAPQGTRVQAQQQPTPTQPITTLPPQQQAQVEPEGLGQKQKASTTMKVALAQLQDITTPLVMKPLQENMYRPLPPKVVFDRGKRQWQGVLS